MGEKKLSREQELEIKVIKLEGVVELLTHQRDKLQQSYLELQNEILGLGSAESCAMEDLEDEYDTIF